LHDAPRDARCVDRLYVYDNSQDGLSPALCFRVTSGYLSKQYATLPEWASDIFSRVIQPSSST
jgi:hypothetical protein